MNDPYGILWDLILQKPEESKDVDDDGMKQTAFRITFKDRASYTFRQTGHLPDVENGFYTKEACPRNLVFWLEGWAETDLGKHLMQKHGLPVEIALRKLDFNREDHVTDWEPPKSE